MKISTDETTLFVETMTVTPHTETGLELAHLASRLGRRVVYCPLFINSVQPYWTSHPGGDHSTLSSLESWLAYVIDRLPHDATLELFRVNDIELPNFSRPQEILSLNIYGYPFGLLVANFISELTKVYKWFQDDRLYQFIHLAHALLIDSVRSYLITKSLIHKHNPSLIVTFNGRTPTTQPILWAANDCDVEILIHERGPKKERFELFTDMPSKFEVINARINSYNSSRTEIMRQSNAARFFKSMQTGNPDYWVSFIGRQDPFSFNKPAYDTFSGKAVFFLSSNDEFDAVVNYNPYGSLGNQQEALKALAVACRANEIELLVRAHPYQSSKQKEIDIYTKLCKDLDVRFIEPNSTINSLMLGLAASKVFTYGSTITWELMYLNVPVGVLGKSVGLSEPGVFELFSTQDINSFLQAKEIIVNKTFPIKFGDFMISSGYNFEIYEAISLGAGNFPKTNELVKQG